MIMAKMNAKTLTDHDRTLAPSTADPPELMPGALPAKTNAALRFELFKAPQCVLPLESGRNSLLSDN